MIKVKLFLPLLLSFLIGNTNMFCGTYEQEKIAENPEEKNSKPVSKPSKQTELKVLQLNVWMGTTMVPGAFGGLVDFIVQLDPDVVLLCELKNEGDLTYSHKLVNALKERGKSYYGENLTLDVGILSKYKIDNPEPLKDAGSILKASIDIRNQKIVLYSAHLDYTHYECYLPRGYSGTTWQKIEAPVTDADSVLQANRISTRDESIKAFLADAQNETGNGNIVIIGGDFNEPSHLDWQEDTKNRWDHNGVVINWDCSYLLAEAGYKDSYREIYPDPVRFPGFTFPSANKDTDVSKLSFCPTVDERDRIDFIYYHPSPAVKLTDARIVGPSGSVYYGEMRKRDAEDVFIEPKGVWPTDHKGNFVTFRLAVRE